MPWSPNLRLVYEANASRALYDCRLLDDGIRSGSNRKARPVVKVHLVWCDMTVGDVAWAASVFSCKYKEANPVARRPMEVHKVDGANHFVSISWTRSIGCERTSDSNGIRSTGKNHEGSSRC